MIPGPNNPFGPLSAGGNLVAFFRDPITTMRRHMETYGPLSGVMSPIPEGAKSFLFAFGPHYNHQVFSDPTTFYSSAMLDLDYPAVRHLANGVTFMNGHEHRAKRRLIMPAFHRGAIERYHTDMVNITDELLNTWTPGEVRDINRDCHHLTARIAIKTLFGLDSTHEGGDIGKLIQQWMTLATSPIVRILMFNWPGTPLHQLFNVSDRLEGHLRTLIARKREHATEGHDVLSSLMQARDEDGSQLSEDELIGQVNVLFLAGHETSGNALTWTLFLLAQHPNIYTDIMDELDAVLAGAPPRPDQLNALPLLECVIQESMRVLPPVVWIQRVASTPFEMGGVSLAAGTTLILSHFMTHHMPDLYPQPRSFRPARFEGAGPSPYEYMAFSSGPRMCIGAGFAMMEMKIALAMILQRYRLASVAGSKIDRHVTVTLSPRKHLPMQVTRRDAPLTPPEPVRGNIHELVDLPTRTRRTFTLPHVQTREHPSASGYPPS